MVLAELLMKEQLATVTLVHCRCHGTKRPGHDRMRPAVVKKIQPRPSRMAQRLRPATNPPSRQPLAQHYTGHAHHSDRGQALQYKGVRERSIFSRQHTRNPPSMHGNPLDLATSHICPQPRFVSQRRGRRLRGVGRLRHKTSNRWTTAPT
jgi:hypothetical protein